MSELRQLSDIERALHEITRLEKEVRLVKDFLLEAVSRQNHDRPKPSGDLIDPRTGRPWRARRR